MAGLIFLVVAADAPQSTPISLRELDVLELVADGLTNHEIAAQLLISAETVKSHVRNLLAKLEARSRAHAVSIGYRSGLLYID